MKIMKKPAPCAVALRYDTEKDQAPRVLAKGSGYIAQKIVQAARRHEIPLVHDPVAGELLSKAELGMEIPHEFYRAVAEILAFIYHLNDRPKVP
jgi:flagellar biosynthesis protein